MKDECHDVTMGRGEGDGGPLQFRLGGVQDCGRRRRHQVVVEPSSHGGSVVWRAEFYSAKAAAELIGIKSMMRDMGWDADIKLHVFATVAQAMAIRQGIGKIRHLEVRHLWLQEMAKSGVIAEEDEQ